MIIAIMFLTNSEGNTAGFNSDSDHKCMAEAMYFEARDQGTLGMLAVGVVIKNRIKHPKYPNTVCAVVRQGKYRNGNPVRYKCQFSFWCDGRHERPLEKEAWDRTSMIAKTLLSESIIDVVGLEHATHYHADWVKPSWSRSLELCSKIGQHVFYAEP